MASKRRRTSRQIQKSPVLAVIMAGIALIGGIISYFHTERRKIETRPPEGSLAVRYLDVGQGDATLLSTSDGQNLLIDTGTNAGADKMVGEIEGYGVDTIDYLILTHNHEDHIGGADEVFDAFNVSNVFLTGREGSDSAVYRKAVGAAQEENGCIIRYAEDFSDGLSSFAFGSATVTVFASPLYPDENENNNSQTVRIDFGTTVFLFTGDAEKEEEEALLDRYGGSLLDADVLQLGHHGSSTSSCDRFLDAVRPGTAIISCGEGNSYGHPHGETLVSLGSRGISYYRTDHEGTVYLLSDGSKIEYRKAS